MKTLLRESELTPRHTLVLNAAPEWRDRGVQSILHVDCRSVALIDALLGLGFQANGTSGGGEVLKSGSVYPVRVDTLEREVGPEAYDAVVIVDPSQETLKAIKPLFTVARLCVCVAVEETRRVELGTTWTNDAMRELGMGDASVVVRHKLGRRLMAWKAASCE